VTGSLPRISIVTSSYNQAHFIGRTIESVLAQGYPDVEHIVVDGMSSDHTVDVLTGYTHLKVIREPDRGQADAINKGFKAATGQIFAFLNSDDTLEPGALHAIAAAIDPRVGRHVVMGRCRFIDERDRFLGVEHPTGFTSHRRVLEIWKGHLLPQPAVFWTREVWETCGPLSIDDRLMLDYDLFCRFSQRYKFWPIDRVLANYRLHLDSITSSMTDAERLEQAIQVSRRYWGSPLGVQYWQVLGSYAAFRLNRRARAVRLMREGRSAIASGQWWRGVPRAVGGGLLAPDVVLDVLVLPGAKPALKRVWGRLGRRGKQINPQTAAWLSSTSRYSDGWAGPVWEFDLTLSLGQHTVGLEAVTLRAGLRGTLEIEAFLDGRSLGTQSTGDAEGFAISWPLADRTSGRHRFRLTANKFVVPHDHFGSQDYRPLAYRPSRVWIQSDGSSTDLQLSDVA
jgi:glycosyltransferase involved in cell wall biosynthesis